MRCKKCGGSRLKDYADYCEHEIEPAIFTNKALIGGELVWEAEIIHNGRTRRVWHPLETVAIEQASAWFWEQAQNEEPESPPETRFLMDGKAWWRK